LIGGFSLGVGNPLDQSGELEKNISIRHQFERYVPCGVLWVVARSGVACGFAVSSRINFAMSVTDDGK
jgi:hypothetical protein